MNAKKLAYGLATFAVVMSPVAASAAVDTKSTTVQATVEPSISMTTSTTVSVSLLPTADGVVSSSSDTVSVSTNNSGGYNLTLADSDANTNLVSGGNSIAAHNGTYAAPTALANNSWGYAVAGGAFDATYNTETNSTTSTTKWAGVPASGSAQLLKTTGSTATNDTTTVWYGVKVNTSQPTGVYSDTVTYTATTN